MEVPKRYLGANIERYQLPDNWLARSMSGCDYVKNVVGIIEERLKHSSGMGSNNKVCTPMEVTYKPEFDTSELLQP